jgi:hypothetical protein
MAKIKGKIGVVLAFTRTKKTFPSRQLKAQGFK